MSLSKDQEMPLGKAMNETELYLSFDNSSQSIVSLIGLKAKSSEEPVTGLLFLKSSTRICYIDGNINEIEGGNVIVNTGDLVEYNKGKLYYAGRSNKQCKVNGKLTNLDILEKVLFHIFH